MALRPDKVHIHGLQAQAIVGQDHWQKPSLQPVAVDVSFSTSFAQAALADDLHYSLNYAVISDKIASFLHAKAQHNFRSLAGLAAGLGLLLENERSVCSAVDVTVAAPKADIRASASFEADPLGPLAQIVSLFVPGTYHIKGIRALTLIGVFTFERLARQYVLMDLALRVDGAHVLPGLVSEKVQHYLELSNFKTVEAVVASCARGILTSFPEVTGVAVSVTKPNAILYTDGVGVSCELSRASFEPLDLDEAATPASHAFDLPVASSADFSGPTKVYVAFGSNMGDQIANITQALALLQRHPRITVECTSALYTLKPMYHTDQADFVNGAVRLTVEDMTPHELLRVLKDIEYAELGRVKYIENGPRPIDLDIVLFGAHTLNDPDLVVPHKSMLERTFVLQPLCELLPPDLTHPVTAEPIHQHLRKLQKVSSDPAVQASLRLARIVPGNGRILALDKSTVIMGIYNATPDSFSDGGDKFSLAPEQIVEQARALARQGAHIIDVGGVSTKPGSVAPLEAEELSRVLPVISAIRSTPDLDSVLVSVDTYRAEVARQAVLAGADIINDVSMGLYEPGIFDVVAQAGCGYVMNHTRGTPQTMSTLTTYESDSSVTEYNLGLPMPPLAQVLVNGICRELSAQLRKAMAAGVRRWQVIVDPGIGFAKDARQNLCILGHAEQFKRYAQVAPDNFFTSFEGLPTLVGASRKKFMGTLTGTAVPEERVFATAAAVTASVQQDVDIVRVHDVAAMSQAAKVADAIYRGDSTGG